MPDPVTWLVLLFYRICCALIHILESIKRFIIEILIGYQSETVHNVPVTEVCDHINKCQSCGSILSTKRAKLRYRTRACKKTKTTTNRKRNKNNLSRGITFYNSKFECNLQKAKKVTLTFEFSPDNNETGETSTINKFVSCSQSDIPESESEVSRREFNQASTSVTTTEIGENPNVINRLVLSSQCNAPESESVKSPGKFKQAVISITSAGNGESFPIKNAPVSPQSHAPESESLKSLGELFHTSGSAASIEIPENSPKINTPDDSSQSDYPESESLKFPVEFKQIAFSATSCETLLKDDQEKESLATNNSQLLSFKINQVAASQTLTLGQDSNTLSLNKLSYSYEEEKNFCALKDFHGSFTELNEATVTDVTMSKDLETKENLASNNSRHIDCELIHTDIYNESTETILKDEKDKESSSLNQLQFLTLEFNQTSVSDKSTEKKSRDKQEKGSVDSNDLQSSSFEINLTSVNMEANLRKEQDKETLQSDDFEISSDFFNQAIHDKIGETILENKLETYDFTKNSLKHLCCDLEIGIETSEEKRKTSRSHEYQSNQDTKLKYQDDRLLDEEILVPGGHEITNTCKKLKTSNDEELQHQAMHLHTNIKSKKPGFDSDVSKIGKNEPIVETTYNSANRKAYANDGNSEKYTDRQNYTDEEQKYETKNQTEIKNDNLGNMSQNPCFANYKSTDCINLSKEENQEDYKFKKLSNVLDIISSSDVLCNYSMLHPIGPEKDFLEKTLSNASLELSMKKRKATADTEKFNFKEKMSEMFSEASKDISNSKILSISSCEADMNTLNSKPSKHNTEIGITDQPDLATDDQTLAENLNDYSANVLSESKSKQSEYSMEISNNDHILVSKFGKSVGIHETSDKIDYYKMHTSDKELESCITMKKYETKELPSEIAQKKNLLLPSVTSPENQNEFRNLNIFSETENKTLQTSVHSDNDNGSEKHNFQVQTPVLKESDVCTQSKILAEIDISAQSEILFTAVDVQTKDYNIASDNSDYLQVLSMPQISAQSMDSQKPDAIARSEIFPESDVDVQLRILPEIHVKDPLYSLALSDVSFQSDTVLKSDVSDKSKILPNVDCDQRENSAVFPDSAHPKVLSTAQVNSQTEVLYKPKANIQTKVSTQPEILLEPNAIDQSKVLIGVVGIQLESLNASEVNTPPEISNGEQVNTDPKVIKTSDAYIQSKVLPNSDVNIQTNIFSEVHGSVQPESLTLSDVSAQQKFLLELGLGKKSKILSESPANLQMKVFPAEKRILQKNSVLSTAQASPQTKVLPATQAKVDVFSVTQANPQTEILPDTQAKAPTEMLMESDVGIQPELLAESDIRTLSKFVSSAVGIQLEDLILSDDNADFQDLTVVPINSPLVQLKISPESNVGARSKILSEDHDNLLSESLTLSDVSAQQKVLPDSGLIDNSKALPEFSVTGQQGVISEAQVHGQMKILTQSDVCAQTVVFPEDNVRTLPSALLDRSQSLFPDIQLTDGKILEQKIIKEDCDNSLPSILMIKAKSKSEKVLTLQEKERDAIHSETPLTHDISMLTSIFSENCNIRSSQILQKQDNFVQQCASSEKENFEITKCLQEKNNKSKVLSFLEILKKENNEALNSEITTSSKLELFPNVEMRKCFPEKQENMESQFPPKTEKNMRSEILKEKICSAQPNVSFVKQDIVKQKIPQRKSDSVKSNVFPEKSNSVKPSGARKKVKRLQRGVQTKDLPTDLSFYENNLSVYQEMYTKTNDPKFSKDKCVHSKISEKDESHKDILVKDSGDNGMDFKITEMTENDKWSNLNSDLSVYIEASTLSFDKAPPLFIDTHPSSGNTEVCFATIPTLPNFDFNEEYPVHIFNKNDILLYNYFTDYQISESEISQSLDNFKINKNQIKTGYNPMLSLPKYWDKMRTDGDRVIVEKCEIKCFIRNTDVSKDIVNKSCINLEESVIGDKNDRELYSTNTYGNKKRKVLSNLDSKTRCTGSRGDTSLDTVSDVDTSDTDDPEFSIFVDSSSKTKDQHLEALSSIKVHELFQPAQQLDCSNQSSFQHKQKLILESSELVKYASENVIKSPTCKEKIIQENLSFENQNVRGKKNICSANQFKTSVTESKYEEEINPSYPTPKFLISFRKADFTGQNSQLKKLEPDEDNLQIKWNTSDKIFYEYVMKNDSSESDLAVAENRLKHSLEESVCNRLTGAPHICDGMFEKENRVYLGKRVIKSVNESQMNENEEEKNNKELIDIFQGADKNIERMRILKLPTNSPPKRRKNVSSPSGSNTFNSEVRNRSSICDSRKCDYKVNEHFPISIIETDLTKDEYESNVKETKQIESTDFIFKTEYSSNKCNTKMNIMSGPAQEINTLQLIKDEYDSNKTKNVEYEVSTVETDNSSESDKNISKTLRTSVQEANDNIPSTEDESHFKETKNMECVTSVLGTVKASSDCDHETEIEATVSVKYLDDSLPSTEDESETNRE